MPQLLTFVLESLSIVIRAALHCLVLTIVVDDERFVTATTLMLHSIGTNYLHLSNHCSLTIDAGHTPFGGRARVAIVYKLLLCQQIGAHVGVEELTYN